MRRLCRFTLYTIIVVLAGCDLMPPGSGSDRRADDGLPDQDTGAQLPDRSSDPDADQLSLDGAGTALPTVWSAAFDASEAGALSSVWGSAPDDLFIVGGTPAQGEVYHFDGSAWQAMRLPEVPLLVWVFGFGPEDVFAVGVGGGVVHYDGNAWERLASGTTDDLWGIWGPAPGDLWLVGGTVGDGEPVIIHFDGSTFTPVPAPDNDRNATSLFKVWGIGSKVFAVGENGLIVEFDGSDWFQVSAGPNADDDFVALWGSSEDNIVAVGGRATGRIALYDGRQWTTHKPTGIPGLNGACMVQPDEAIVGGVSGYVGRYDPQANALTTESASGSLDIHAIWGDGAGRYYGVGGRFTEPYEGVALVRTLGDPGIDPAPPLGLLPECETDSVCPVGEFCRDGECAPVPGCAGTDDDGDGWLASCDNCPGYPNKEQQDQDGDGVGDVCDTCPGFDDGVDADADGVPDGCEVCPAGDDHADSDGDGQPDDCDTCAGFDDSADSDGDGVPDGCDACDGGDDHADSDADGTPDDCDLCPGFDDHTDADSDGLPDGCDSCATGDVNDGDGDGVADACDVCPGGDDHLDSDDDGRPDACDLCPGSDDSADADNDAVPNGCDACPGFADRADADADGVPDGCDVCAGGNDHSDTDTDGVPNFCDVCPGFDDGADADLDGVPDGCDICPGYDDNVDDDGNGIPDGCCTAETDCILGEACDNGVCEPAGGPDLEIGIGGGNYTCVPAPYRKVYEGDELPICEGFQGFTEIWLDFRVTGFVPNASVDVTRSLILTQTTCTDNSDCAFSHTCLDEMCSPTGVDTFARQLADAGDGLNELLDFGDILFDSVETLDGQDAFLSVTIADQTEPSVTVTLELNLLLFAKRLCYGDTCPEGQICVDSYCERE
ncbi:MAG: beta propeller repeat protein [Planctomycetota bacterium]|jgi:hypothetical protein